MKQIDVADLKVGMHVAGVIDPKTKVSLKRCGVVRCLDIIQQLKDKGIKQVFIDQEGDELDQRKKEPKLNKSNRSGTSLLAKSNNQDPHEHPENKSNYQLIDQTLKESKAILTEYCNALNNNGNIDIEKSIEVANKLTDMILLDKDSIQLVTMAKNLSNDLFEHLVNTAVISGIFSQSLGFDKSITQNMVLAGLLHDIGKMFIPEQLAQSSNDPSPIFKEHINMSRDIISCQFPHIPALSKTAILQNCERIDGSGYPHALHHQEISYFAKMMAIVDQFETNRFKKDARATVANILKLLLQEAGKSLNRSLVHQFIKCMGAYPPGSLVVIKQHTKKRIALVTHSENGHPSQPKVKVFYNLNSKHYIKMEDIYLSSPKCQYTINRACAPHEYNIDMNKLLSQCF